MTNTVEIQSTPEGYKSAEAKKRFTIGAAVVGVLGFLAPMLIPFAMFPVMCLVMFSMVPATNSRSSAEIPLEGSVWWRNRIWYLSPSETTAVPGRPEFLLKSLAIGETARQAKIEGSLWAYDDAPQLLATGARLWILTESGLAYFKDGRLEFFPGSEWRGDQSIPFLFEGKPAALELRPDRVNLLTAESGSWSIRATGNSVFPEGFSMRQLRCVQTSSGFHLFRKCGATIFAAAGLPRDQWKPDWRAIAKTDSHLEVAAIDDQPAIFFFRDDRLCGLTLEDGSWRSYCDVPLSHNRDLRVFAASDSGGTLIVRNANGRLSLSKIENGALMAETSGDSIANPFPGDERLFIILLACVAFIWCTALGIFPFTMLVALSFLMNRYRIAECRIRGQTVEYASLMRRGLAMLADTLIFGLPVIIGWAMLFWQLVQTRLRPGDEPSPEIVWTFFGLFAACFVISLLCQVVLSFMEGRWGLTPGKWFLKIRVWNLELQPCGFWRALLRRLLLIVDSFFSNMVGMLLVAFLPRWQRLGDLAAGTIVVREFSCKPRPDRAS